MVCHLRAAGSAHDVTAGWGLSLHLRVCSTGRSVAPWPRWAAHRHGQPATLQALSPLSAELQGRAGAHRPAEPRQHGECVPRLLAHTRHICGAEGALFLHLTPNTHSLTLAAPYTPLPMVLPEEEHPLLLKASSPSCAHPAPCPPATACLPLLPVAMVFSSASPSAS